MIAKLIRQADEAMQLGTEQAGKQTCLLSAENINLLLSNYLRQTPRDIET